MGNGFSNGSEYVERSPVRQVSAACSRIVLYMTTHGIDVDIDVEAILYEMGLAATGSGGFGIYTGRINKNEQLKGSSLRIVPGRLQSTFRLTRIR